MANIQNLTPYKKGDDPSRWAKSGRPKGSKSIKKIFKQLLSQEVQIEDPQGNGYITLDTKTAIALKLIVDAYDDGDPNVRHRAAKMIFDHTDPLKTKVDHTTKGESINTPFSSIPLADRLKIIEILENANKGESEDEQQP